MQINKVVIIIIIVIEIIVIIMEYEGNGDTDSNWCARNDHQRLDKVAGRVGNRRKSRDHLNYSIIVIGQNTEKSPRDLGRLAVTLTPVKDHQLTQV